MSIVRPRRRRIPTVLTGGSSSRPMNLFPNERSRSIFALLDGYDDRSDNGPPPSLDSHMEMNTDDVPVVNVQDSSDGEGTDEATSRPSYCKICIMESKKVKTHGEASNQIRKETPLKCVICFSATTEGGTHHPHAMRCGHIFGKSCIDSWIGAKMPSTVSPCLFFWVNVYFFHFFFMHLRFAYVCVGCSVQCALKFRKIPCSSICS
ncbi:uncharacterized protein LOC131009304 [Salvia miltiorrhiza]|uniref:uncharacterized protein LOC131009304 n=1 Tax=Salvia miltiorrhiza TaxID=226208 RepID=UPI0025AD01FF|nr:uncharacterized protein LOC131009304 [Salvia miltiorrhiza]